jgi:galactokinase
LKDFAALFGGAPEVSASAPGRVNLLGEHTDYNDGFVLPTTIPQHTTVSMGRSNGNAYRVYSEALDATAEFRLDSPPDEHFARYVYGCVRIAASERGRTEPLNIHVRSDVPIGAGLSSSAALEVATLRALRALDLLNADDVTIARLAQRAEIEYAGVQCGILDQMASSLLTPGSMLFLDTRTFERRLLPLPAGSEVLVVDSGISRSLASSKYNERRAECEEAARRLGCPSLRDVTDGDAVERLPEPFRRRARHVLAENARVLAALSAPSAEAFGTLMSASHASLRDDYEVSIAALDDLARMLGEDECVFGAKLTGAGFGGAVVALCALGHAERVGRRVLARYDTDDRSGSVLVPPA